MCAEHVDDVLLARSWGKLTPMSESSPFDSLIAAASELVGELSSALPRLLERSKDQLAIVVALAEKLPCVDLGGGSAEPCATDRAATPSPVAAITSAPSAVAAARKVVADSPSKKAPAKKVVAKKAPAKKVVAKKAPAKKAPAKKVVAKKAAPAAPASNPLGLSSYDSLAASQVIPRLDALSTAELEAVRAHESAGRNRRTILNRVAQLQRG